MILLIGMFAASLLRSDNVSRPNELNFKCPEEIVKEPTIEKTLINETLEVQSERVDQLQKPSDSNQKALATMVCDCPAPNSGCTPPNTWDINVVANGANTWLGLGLGNSENVIQKIRISGSGTVTIPNGNLILGSPTAVVYIDGPELILNNGNLQLAVSGSKFLMTNGKLRTFSSFQQTSNTVVCITGSEVEIGDELAGGTFNTTGNPSSSADWQNDGGYRYLYNNCINVTHDYQLQSTGTGTGINGVDVICKNCFEIGDRGQNHALGTAFGVSDGDDSGNWQNSNRQFIYETSVIVANGNFQTSNNTMSVCDIKVKVNKTGSFQVNSGLFEGTGVCVAVEDIFENSGTWTATGISWYSEKQNSTNVPGAGLEQTKATILNNCFATCCNPVVCVTPNAGPNIELCSPNTSFDFPNATGTQKWVVISGVAVITPYTGIASGINSNGVYTFALRDTAINNCEDQVTLTKLTCANTELCFKSTTGDSRVGARIEWTIDNVAKTVKIRTTFAKTFVDNTYGTNAIGWPGGHTFGNLDGSDNLQLALYDNNGVKRLEFKQDYIDGSNATPSGYDCLGVTGGEGQMIVGNAASILSATSSLDQNLNTFNYVLLTNSPATDGNYTPNPTYPNWIFDVWYEVTVDLNVFGASGFGTPFITSVHASPSKTGNNTEPVDSMKCPDPLELKIAGNCVQDCTEDIISTVNGLNSPFTYLWSTGATTKDLNNVCAGSYSMTVTDANNKTASASVVVEDNTCPGGELCFKSTTGDDRVGARIEWKLDNANNTVIIRTIFAKTFVDNTYGTNAIGWPGGHTFGNLTGSDHVQLALYDKLGVKKLEFRQDYLTSDGNAPSGYSCLGVTGGEGQMLVGNASSIKSATSSLDVNFNTYGYVLTSNSPATNANYDPNATYPDWIYEVWYETVVDQAAFGAAGFGTPFITSVHASPSKTGNNTEPVDSMKCPGFVDITLKGNCIQDCSEDLLTTVNSTHPPFTYAWSTGSAAKDLLNVCAGTYSVTVTDALGNTGSSSVAVTDGQCLMDSLCFKSTVDDDRVTAKIHWTIDQVNNTVKIRTIFAKTFVDNTYGTTRIGWPGDHKFGDLVGSDKLQLALFDKNGVKKLEFEQDYISATGTVPSGYASLGVTGGEGDMILGNASSILDWTTSLDENFNTYGYILTTNSPATNANYNTNPSYPNWIFDVWYEVTVDLAAFGPAGFGRPFIASVHASPSKTGNNTEPVDSMNCVECIITNVTANVGTCNPANNTYSVSGQVFFNTNITTGTLIVSDGAVQQIFSPPFISPIAYNLTGLTADGSAHAVVAKFSVDTTCKFIKTYTAPPPCGPNIRHTKDFISATRTGLNTYNIAYSIVVTNTGGAGVYDLFDRAAFDDDITINNVSYFSNAPGNPGGVLFGSGPWTLANNQAIAANSSHLFNLIFSVTIDLESGSSGNNIYFPCGMQLINRPSSGEALFNESQLDGNNDGFIEQRDTACAELPYIVHTKSYIGQIQTGPRSFTAQYQIRVQNLGGATGTYNLTDRPAFDNDINISGASYATNAPANPGNPGPAVFVSSGPWILASDAVINAGGVHTYNLNVNISINLEGGGGDDRYDQCGRQFSNRPVSGEGLFNESNLDVNDDGTADQKDTACADVPYIVHEKLLVGVLDQGSGNFRVTYAINVRNLGGASGNYDLNDAPSFDDDFTITSAQYSSTAIGNPGNPGPLGLAGAGPWVLANNQSIAAFGNQSYTLTVFANIDLANAATAGDEIYRNCGYSVPGIPRSGEGLFNESRLDVNDDGTPDQRDTACADIPQIIHNKTLVGVTPTGLNTYTVEYKITVENKGALAGNYALYDAPSFENDINILGANYSSNVPGHVANPGPVGLIGTGPWVLNIGQTIAGGAVHMYNIRVNVSINLQGGGGDDRYVSCGTSNINFPISGEGLFNESRLDVSSDGSIDQRDTACADLPYIIHEKTIAGLVQTGPRNFQVLYRISVRNIGSSFGTYALSDRPAFDNDITITSAQYNTDAPGHIANPGPLGLAGTGPWTLATNQGINPGATQIYFIRVNLTINLEDANGDNRYDQCGKQSVTFPISGEGLFNESRLDVNSDGTIDQRDTACTDVPYIVHTKSLVGVNDFGGGNFRVTYRIDVNNLGGIASAYDLTDAPNFDDDVNIVSAFYTSNASGHPANPGPIGLAGAGPWLLANDQNINAFSSQFYQLTIDFNLDLVNAGSPGDEVYRPCGFTVPGTPRVGEGLFNETRLDVNNDGTPDQRDTACADIPQIIHRKDLINVTRTGVNSYAVDYRITVENKGGSAGLYSLSDAPQFDNDINITSANYSSNAPGNVANPGPVGLAVAGPWNLAANQAIVGGGTHQYNLRVHVVINLEGGGGDDRYDECGNAFITYPIAGEGLFNESRLDIGSNGSIDQRDSACADLPYLVHEKSIVGVTQTGVRTFQVTYKINVRNIGGASGTYALSDRPAFDNDITILNSNYSNDAPAHPANPGPLALAGSGPWSLANNQGINAGAVHMYTIRVNVSINLEDVAGDNRYDECGNAFITYPISGEGLFNESRLDIHSDGSVDQMDTACADLPYIVHTKSIQTTTDLGGGNYRVVYRIDVNNLGGAPGNYDLSDQPTFDDDIIISNASYTSNAVANPGNPGPQLLGGIGPWTLANNQTINAFSSQNYLLTVNVSADFVNAFSPGDEIYRQCGFSIPGVPRAGEGLFNESRLDVNDDGTPDQRDTACADIPQIIHRKDLVGVTKTGLHSYTVEYKITVENKGGAPGVYALFDAPNFENDINITGANYSSDAPGNLGNPGPLPLFGTGPWTLAGNQTIQGGGIHMYSLRVNVVINLEGGGGDNVYDECGNAFISYPKVGEGLFNESRLDIGSNGTIDQLDTACADLPYIIHDKTVVGVVQTGVNTFRVTYQVRVRNIGGSTANYNLFDSPYFDDDVIINSANYTSTVVTNPGGPLFGTGPWLLALNQSIGSGGIHLYTVNVDATLNLTVGSGGDNLYRPCTRITPIRGEGLFNEARLEVNGFFAISTVCADVPYIVHRKSIQTLQDLGGGNFRVIYRIDVDNLGGTPGSYNLDDVPQFDDDLTILNASYTSTAPANAGNPGPSPLFGTGPWSLASDQNIVAFGSHSYFLTVNVFVDLVNAGSPGDELYRQCGYSIPGVPRAGEGLFNESLLDVDDNGIPDQRDTACADIPQIVHRKDLVGVTRTGMHSYTVEYKITVENKGGAPGNYTLSDAPNFENDINITGANYSSNAPGNVANPGPIALAGLGPWLLAGNQAIAGGGIHMYNLRVNVVINLEGGGGDNIYDECGNAFISFPKVGEGLFNESRLDIGSNGSIDQLDTACADLPYIIHEKTAVGVIQTGFNTFRVTYQINVRNLGGISGNYNLFDTPYFDDDVTINNANYTTSAFGNPGNPGPSALAGSGPWLLAINQAIGSGSQHLYTVSVNVTVDLTVGSSGDNIYRPCTRITPIRGEGLFNEARLEVNGFFAISTVCLDPPYIVHRKSVQTVQDLGGGNFRVVYRIDVDNLGGVAGTYNLQDAPNFDNDLSILNASYTSTAPANAGNPGPSPLFGTGPWSLASDQNIVAFGSHSYFLTVNVFVDLVNAGSPGDEIYRQCGFTTPGVPRVGEGLFNESLLDVDDDGVPDQRDTACADIPQIVHRKDLVGVTRTGMHSYTVEYKITVENKGGAPGNYTLSDAPNFENDINITGANYSSNAPGNVGNPGPIPLAGLGPWILAGNQAIAGGGIHMYTLRVNVVINLTGGGGDDRYETCGATFITHPKIGEGLFNESRLDVGSNGSIDQLDTACADLPYIIHEKTAVGVIQTGFNTFKVTYQINVRNLGGVSGNYNLFDTPYFDDDVTINNANYTTTAFGNPGNPGPSPLAGAGPWLLAINQAIASGSQHFYTVSVNVTVDLTVGSSGDNIYRPCTRFTPVRGEGLFNEARLEVSGFFAISTVCIDPPYIVHRKSVQTVQDLGGGNFRVVYRIDVDNLGGVAGTYNLQDAPNFDDDLSILNASYTSTAPANAGNPGPSPLFGTGPWSLASDQNIVAFGSHSYFLTVNVFVDLVNAGSPGDELYRQCGYSIPGVPRVGEGLFNESLLDVNDDGIPDQRDTACADIPQIVHHKDLVGVTRTGLHSYIVEYKITVENKGGAPGNYSLTDAPNFDNDINITGANYSSNAPGNVGNPGPIPLAGLGPWLLAGNQAIAIGGVHMYNLRVNVVINLTGGGGDDRYDACGAAFITHPKIGEGLFNESRLDIGSNGSIDQLDTACADLPYIVHEKTIQSVVQTGVNTFRIIYQIGVRNLGGVSGNYNLFDTPYFDDDVNINNASYTSNVVTNPGGPLFGTGPWLLALNQILGGGGVHTYTVTVNVTLDLTVGSSGDNVYRPCQRFTPVRGEGFYNEARLEVNGFVAISTVCTDPPYITHRKSVQSVQDLGGGNFRVVYRIDVDNLGGLAGTYDLVDAPNFDDDLSIVSASYTTTAIGNPGNPGPAALFGSGPWILANNQNIGATSSQAYFLTVNVFVDLVNAASPGDEVYRECGYTVPGIPRAGEGMFNESRLDIDDDGIPDQRDTACADIPQIVHEKTFVSATRTGTNSYLVEYKITVQNKGGATGNYSLSDAPNFDNDINITGANYSSNAPGNAGNPGSVPLAGTGPWNLASNQSINGGAIHMYNIRVNVAINLQGGGGDDRYDACGETFTTYPKIGEGLFNESRLDIGSNGSIDQRDTACADLPYLIHDKSIAGVIQTGPRTYQVTYKINVRNIGGTSASYALSDRPAFDNDITILGTNYSSDAPGNIANPGPIFLGGNGPWLLANSQNIAAGSVHMYSINVNVYMNLEDGIGDNRYDQCGRQFGFYPISNEGLFNESRLDIHSDGTIDQRDTACADLPYIVHAKSLVSTGDLGGGNYRIVYRIDVRNLGAVGGTYNLTDAPAFDDDVVIVNTNYVTNAAGNPGNPGPANLFGNGPWTLANNQFINGFGQQQYTISFNVSVDLTNPASQGDEVLSRCGTEVPGLPISGEGFFNESLLDIDRDGNPDQRDTVCTDVDESGLGDKVWIDLNYNGIQDLNEPKVPNVIVSLYDCSNGQLVRKDTTDANGCYFFDKIVGNKDYFVKFDLNTLPAGYGITLRNAGIDDRVDSDIDAAGVGLCTHIDPGERDSTYDAGIFPFACLADFVWHDKDGNGLQDFGEEGIPGVVIKLYASPSNILARTTVTDSNGIYAFKNLIPGDYYVKMEVPAGYTITIPNMGNDARDSDIDNSNGPNTTATTHLDPGENDTTWDLGLLRCAMIGGDVWFDIDMDGIYDPEEKGINGLRVYIVDAMTDAVVATLTTSTKPGTASDDGYYKVPCLRPGMYYVRFERPGHLAASLPFRGNNRDKDSDITHAYGANTTNKITVLAGDMVLNIGAGFQIKATLGGKVWVDHNMNGIQDVGESALPGVNVTAYNEDGAFINETETNHQGSYAFDAMIQGDYFVKFKLPNAHLGFTVSHAGSEDSDSDVDGTYGYGTTRLFRIKAGEAKPNIDAGVVTQARAAEGLEFTGKYDGTFTTLNWTTLVDMHCDNYIVERSYNSKDQFVQIGNVDALEDFTLTQHNYQFEDHDVTRTGDYYYRLKQYEKDGRFEYSKIVSVKVSDKGDQPDAHLYPNPANHSLNIELWIPEDSDIDGGVVDHLGKEIIRTPFNGFFKKGSHTMVLNTGELIPGQYVLRIKTTHGMISKKFTIMR